MKLTSLTLLFCVALPLAAQTAPDSKLQITPETRSALVKLGGQLMIDGKAYEYDRQLADEIGPRLTGSDNYVKATEYARNEFTRLGLSNPHFEAWTIPATWEPEKFATGRIIKPHEQRLHIESEGWSPSTPEGGVRGEVFYLKAATSEQLKADAASIKDKIILVDGETMQHSGKLYTQLFAAIAQLKELGARALILGIGATNNTPSMIGLTNFDGELANIVAGNLGQEDSTLLRRMLEHGTVEVEFSFKNKIRKNVTVNNVVAEIPGSDKSGEFIVIGGHLDSWNPGTGAEDNGTGAASVLAIADAIKMSGLTPRRTIRFVLFGGEEEGLIGSVHYARDHTSEMSKCAGVFITDTGSEPPLGWYIFGRADEKAALGAINPLLSSLGAAQTTDDGRFTFSTDHGPFLIQGVPAFVLWTPLEKYFNLHHKASDTFDKVNQRDLNLGVAVVGITAYAFADSATMLKHYSMDEMEKQLKEIKSYDEYKDMADHKLF